VPTEPSAAPSAALGEFLRSRRERLTPAEVGISPSSRRRTPGLRREEVAELAGISVDWYIRLEQGRSLSASQGTITALAQALRLSDVESRHLQTLATQHQRRSFERETVPPGLRNLIDALNLPAYVTGRRWDVLAWNEAASDLFGDFGELPEGDRNILIFMLTNPAARTLFGRTWTAEAKRMVAQFRATHDLWNYDPAFVDLIDRLKDGCKEFQDWWADHDIRDAPAGIKSLHHAGRGTVLYAYETFQSNADPALRVAIYTPEAL